MAATTIGNSASYTAVLSDHVTPSSGSFAWYMTPEDMSWFVQFMDSIKYNAELGINITYQLGKTISGLVCKNIRISPAPSGAIAYGYTTDTIASGQGTAALTMTTASTIALNALAGLQCTINGVNYTISSNTATTGADIVVITLTGNSAGDVNTKSLTILTAFAELQKLKQALWYWATGNGGEEFGGYLLYVSGKDINNNDWTMIGSYATPKTLAVMRARLLDQIQITPQPNGDFLIQQLKITHCTPVTEEST